MPRVLAVYGTRPEAIKMAPLVNKAGESPHLELTVAVTGQHREMLDQVNDAFGIQPAYDLDIMRPGASLAEMSAAILTAFEPVLAEVAPDVVVVQGDTTSAFVAGLAAFYNQVKVVHLEAGLRTSNIRNPFPEEANRRLVATIADLHLAPTRTARDNLLAEGIDKSAVTVTGNTVIDSLHHVLSLGSSTAVQGTLGELIATGSRYVLVTAHRRESWGEPMRQAAMAIASTAQAYPDLHFVFPMHRNQKVRESVVPVLGPMSNVHLTEPLGYLEFAHALKNCHIALTDSGGVQEEAPSLGKPVLVMRDTTERPEAVSAGTARLVGTDASAIFNELTLLLESPEEYATMADAVNPYGDGMAAHRAVAAIEELLGVGARVPEFEPPARS